MDIKFHNYGRDNFANITLKMLYKAYNGDIDAIMKSDDIEWYSRGFYDNVNGIESYIEDIPLFRLYELLKNDWDEYHDTEDEYKEEIVKVKEQIHEYYN